MNPQSQPSTGYGPSANSRFGRLLFDGDDNNYEMWEEKFLGYMKLRNLKEIILADDATVTANANDDTWLNSNEEAYAELIQFLDDTSLNLIMRDARNDGRKALCILRNHYVSRSKPRVITLYTELTSLLKVHDESITEYILRAETAASALKASGETVSDSLLIAMCLKGLPEEYKSFTIVISQKDHSQLTFSEFKTHLRNFEETEKFRSGCTSKSDSIMKNYSSSKHESKNVKCFSCDAYGHVSKDCKIKKKLFCEYCKRSGHNDNACRKKKKASANDSSKGVSQGETESHSFAFMVNEESMCKVKCENSLLVDCGATSHIITDRSKFIEFDKTFEPESHFIELANGTREHSTAKARGRVIVNLRDSAGKVITVTLSDALFIPTYPNDIFSVRAAAEKGAVVVFGDKSYMQAKDGTRFNIVQSGRLYYFDNGLHTVTNVNKFVI